MAATQQHVACPVCKSDTYLTVEMKLLLSPCYHRICTACVDRLFSHGAAPCPVCGTLLRRSNFVTPIFEDAWVEKECRIRRRIAAIFNKAEGDFDGLPAYNDYLEHVEEIIFRLINDSDVQKTNALIERYRVENVESIASRRAAMQREEEALLRESDAQETARRAYEESLLASLEEAACQRAASEKMYIERLAAGGDATSDQRSPAGDTTLRLARKRSQAAAHVADGAADEHAMRHLGRPPASGRPAPSSAARGALLAIPPLARPALALPRIVAEATAEGSIRERLEGVDARIFFAPTFSSLAKHHAAAKDRPHDGNDDDGNDDDDDDEAIPAVMPTRVAGFSLYTTAMLAISSAQWWS